MLRTPFVGDVSADFSPKSVELELQPHVLIAQAREVCCGRLQIETAAQSEPGEGQTIGLPVSCAAQLRKSLVQPRRRDHDLGRAEPASLGFARKQEAASQKNQGWAVLSADFQVRNAQIFREQSLQSRPAPLAYRSQVWIAAAHFHAQFADRKIANHAAARVQKDMLKIQTNPGVGGSQIDTKRIVARTFQAKLANHNRTQKRGVDIFNISNEAFPPGHPPNPQANAIGNSKWRERNRQ